LVKPLEEITQLSVIFYTYVCNEIQLQPNTCTKHS